MRNLKKAFSDGYLIFFIAMLVTTICIPSDNIYVNKIIAPIGLILLILSGVIVIKNYIKDKKSNQTYESQDKQ
jgi:hypothetical protein